MGALKQSITKEYLTALENISIAVKNKISGGYSGIRKSRNSGNSLEFSDYRNYSPGDDVRNIDWRGFGRFDKLFLKLFYDEKQAAVNIFLDKSKSMDFGSPNKFLYAGQAAASIAYVAIKNLDRVSIFSVDEEISLQKSNIHSRGAFPETVNFLDGITPDGGTYLNRTIKALAESRVRPGASFIITDLYSEDGFQDAIKALQAKRNDVTLIHVLSPEEVNPQIAGPMRLLDLETNSFHDLVVTETALAKYRAALADYRKSITEFCSGRGVNYISAVTDTTVLKIFA